MRRAVNRRRRASRRRALLFSGRGRILSFLWKYRFYFLTLGLLAFASGVARTQVQRAPGLDAALRNYDVEGDLSTASTILIGERHDHGSAAILKSLSFEGDHVVYQESTFGEVDCAAAKVPLKPGRSCHGWESKEGYALQIRKASEYIRQNYLLRVVMRSYENSEQLIRDTLLNSRASYPDMPSADGMQVDSTIISQQEYDGEFDLLLKRRMRRKIDNSLKALEEKLPHPAVLYQGDMHPNRSSDDDEDKYIYFLACKKALAEVVQLRSEQLSYHEIFHKLLCVKMEGDEVINSCDFLPKEEQLGMRNEGLLEHMRESLARGEKSIFVTGQGHFKCKPKTRRDDPDKCRHPDKLREELRKIAEESGGDPIAILSYKRMDEEHEPRRKTGIK